MSLILRENNMISADSLRNDMVRLSIRPDETILVHSSMKSIGPVDGGADAVPDMLMEYFRDAGLLVFPTLSYREVNEEHPRFDVRKTPACTGILPELFRRRPGVVRSLHPTHSLAAYGKDAREFTAGHEKFDTPAAQGSPWWRLLERGARIWFIGTGISCNTFCHGVDEWIHAEGILTAGRQQLEVADENGNVIPVPSRRHCMGRNAYYGECEGLFDRAGAIVRGRFGEAQCHFWTAERSQQPWA